MEDSENQNNTTQGGDDKVDSPFTAPDNSPEAVSETQSPVESPQPQAEPQAGSVQPSFGGPQPPVGDNISVQTPGTPFNSSAPSGAPIVGGPVMSSPQKSGGKGKKIAIILISVLVFLLLAGGLAAFFVINHLNNKPEKVLADAIANTTTDLLARKPISTVSKITYVGTADDDKYNVTVDLSTLQKDKDGKLEAKVKIESKEINLDVSASVMVFGSEELYIKVDNLQKTVDSVIDQLAVGNDIPSTSQEVTQVKSYLKPLITKLDGKWVKITSEDIKGLMGSGASSVEPDKCTEALEALRISDDDKKELKRLFSENQFFTATEELGRQDAGGENSFHYVIKVNEDPAVNFMKGTVKLKSFERAIKDCDIDTDIKKPESTENTLEESKLELWVGAKTRRFTKIRLTNKEKTVEFDMSSELTFQEASTTIQKPTDFITVKDLQAEIEKLSGDSLLAPTGGGTRL